jgi:hypothetical protein
MRHSKDLVILRMLTLSEGLRHPSMLDQIVVESPELPTQRALLGSWHKIPITLIDLPRTV